MKQPLRSCVFLLTTLVLLASPAARVAAHEDGGDGITLRAPLDAVDCTTTPPTITVLGLTIDISTATIGGSGEGDGGGEHDVLVHDSDGNEGDDGGAHDGEGAGHPSGSCADLVAGQCVDVTFASDAAPLVATKVKQCGEDDGVEIKAPLQGVDSGAQTVTLLGLTIDVSTATLSGNDGEGDSQPIDLGQAMPGQRAEVHLDATKPPALATEVEVRIDSMVVLQAPLDAVDCAAAPPTVTVLGLTIDVSTATIHADCDDGEDDFLAPESADEGDEQGDDDGDEDGGHGCGCAALVPGKLVRVVLASDATPLVATQVKRGGEDDDDDGVEIKAPLQAVDSAAQTVTLLGLTLDVSTAGLDGGSPPIDFTQLVVGQIAEAHLDATKLPALVATTLQVTNVGSDIDVEVDDPSGTEIDDPTDDVNVDVTDTVTVRRSVGGRRLKTTTTVHFHTTAHGSFHLSGLPPGSAKISVTRVQGGVTMARSRSARLKSNKAHNLRLRLRRMH
ncbi:MAG: hypothetical protein HY271_02085 [Deltaproteobacteria bacterium]|nr:hypothetical protein [Deltaproteobacteria bacterium]